MPQLDAINMMNQKISDYDSFNQGLQGGAEGRAEGMITIYSDEDIKDIQHYKSIIQELTAGF